MFTGTGFGSDTKARTYGLMDQKEDIYCKTTKIFESESFNNQEQ